MATKENNQTDNDVLINDEKDIPRVIEVLLSEKSTIPSWIQTKEASSWSALLFYFALLWYFNELVFNKIILLNEDSVIVTNYKLLCICVLLVPPILWYIFFRFMHAHYQQSYFTFFRNTATRNVILEITKNKLNFFKNNVISDPKKLNEYISRKANEECDKFFKNKKTVRPHPLKIVIALWLGLFKNDRFKSSMMNTERQEAALYSLLSFSTFLFEIYLIIILEIF